MTLPLDLMLGDTGPKQPEHECPYEYVEWIRDSLRHAHNRAHKTLKTSAKRQCGGYEEPNQIVRFHHSEWVWRAYPQQGGKLHYTNRGPWLVLDEWTNWNELESSSLRRTGRVTYKIQRQPQAEPDIMHVDKLIPYYLNFRERPYCWIETDHLTQYRDQEAQTFKPVLQDQPVTVVDILPQISNPTPDPEPAEPHPNATSPTREPVETNEANTA